MTVRETQPRNPSDQLPSPPLLSATIFQPPLPPILLLVPPSHPLQWLLRTLLLTLSITLAFPLIALFIPISIACLVSPRPSIRALAPLPIHPDNLPPHLSIAGAVLRGWWVYATGSIVWSITSLGSPPVSSEARSRTLARVSLVVLESFGRGVDWWFGGFKRMRAKEERLVVREERLKKVSDEVKIGVMNLGEENVGDESNDKEHGILAFWLYNTAKENNRTTTLQKGHTSDRRVYLFLAGGGYVTGWPLAHPFLFSLARTFPPEPLTPDPSCADPKGRTQTPPHRQVPHRAILSPDIRRSVTRPNSFPIPLLDALSAYIHLRTVGYRANEITLMGDSAGGGLSWSLMAYLAILHERDTFNNHPNDSRLEGPLGIPGGIILISPWLALPPVPINTSAFPDFLDDPQLLNAARCYLGRYPLLRHRPDPFSSDLSVWTSAISREMDRMTKAVGTAVKGRGWGRLARGGRRRGEGELSDSMAKEALLSSLSDIKVKAQLMSDETVDDSTPLSRWLDVRVFTDLSSHHPLISPCSHPLDAALALDACTFPNDSDTLYGSISSHNTTSVFVRRVLRYMAANKTRMLISSGTAEWFHSPAMRLLDAAEREGVEVTRHDEVGGFHVEGCLFPAEIPGPGRRLVCAINAWDGRGE